MAEEKTTPPPQAAQAAPPQANRLYDALVLSYQADVNEALAVLELYLTRPVGVGDHPDFVSVLKDYTTKLDEAVGKLETLQRFFGQDQQPPAQG